MSDLSGPTRIEFVRTAVLRETYLTDPTDALPDLRADLRQAWERSRTAGVPSDRRSVPLLLDGPSLEEYRESHEVFCAGRPALEAAADLLVGTGHGILLSDARGTVLYVGGDQALTTAAEQVGSLPGATWREDLVGNNAIGTALVTGKPVQFQFSEHWCAGWADWVCAAAPILDRDSRAVLAAVALCARRQVPDVRLLTMATRLAFTLERQVQTHRQQRAEQLRSEAIKLSGWFPEQGAVAVDRAGVVVWASRNLPQGLLTALQSPAGRLPCMGRRGEQEVLVADRYPCLVIPVWNGGEWQGHVLITQVADNRPAVRTKGERGRPLCVVAIHGDRRLVFTPEQVLAVRTIGGQIHVITDSGEWPTAYESIAEVQQRLPEEPFFQVDRGCLVNLTRIKEIRPMFNRTVNLVLADRKGTEIPVSRRRTANLRLMLNF